MTRKERTFDCAIRYADLGWLMLPLWSVDENGKCLCGNATCSSPGKHPHGRYAANGSKDATNDGAVIAGWFNNSDINIGICAGQKSQLVILDVDPQHGGNESLKKFGTIPQTPHIKTGGGGMHYYFKHPGGDIRNSAGTLGAGLDVRGHHGYVVAPPSLHASGEEYKWLIDPTKAPLADIPKWLLNTKKKATVRVSEQPTQVPEGRRNNAMTVLAGKLRRTGLGMESIYAALIYENERKCNPPLPDNEILTIAKSIAQYAPDSLPTNMTPVSVNFADITPEKVEWLWDNRIPMGKLTLFVGDPGLGKSFLTLYLAAHVTTGMSWPDDPFNQPILTGQVIILTAEDDISDTVLPRLLTNRADTSKIVAIQGVNRSDVEGQVYFNLVEYLSALEQAIEEKPGTRLVIIDPISAYLGKTDSHKNAEVRSALAPLAALAAKHKVAVVAVSYLNKNAGARATYRIMGSMAFTAADRAVWVVSKDQNDPKRRLLTPCKTNLSVDPTSLAFSVIEGIVSFEPEQLQITTEEALSLQRDEDGSALEEAEEFLRECLKEGPVKSKEVYKDAEDLGIAKATLRRAIKELKVKKEKEKSFGGAWTMKLPEGAQ